MQTRTPALATLLAATLAAACGPADSGNPPATQLHVQADHRDCLVDTDCAVLYTDCSGCTVAGVAVAFEDHYELVCNPFGGQDVCTPACTPVALCNDQQCDAGCPDTGG